MIARKAIKAGGGQYYGGLGPAKNPSRRLKKSGPCARNQTHELAHETN